MTTEHDFPQLEGVKAKEGSSTTGFLSSLYHLIWVTIHQNERESRAHGQFCVDCLVSCSAFPKHCMARFVGSPGLQQWFPFLSAEKRSSKHNVLGSGIDF